MADMVRSVVTESLGGSLGFLLGLACAVAAYLGCVHCSL